MAAPFRGECKQFLCAGFKIITSTFPCTTSGIYIAIFRIKENQICKWVEKVCEADKNWNKQSGTLKMLRVFVRNVILAVGALLLSIMKQFKLSAFLRDMLEIHCAVLRLSMKFIMQNDELIRCDISKAYPEMGP